VCDYTNGQVWAVMATPIGANNNASFKRIPRSVANVGAMGALGMDTSDDGWLFIACLHRRTVLCVQYTGDESVTYPHIVLNNSVSPPPARPDSLGLRGGTPDSTNQRRPTDTSSRRQTGSDTQSTGDLTHNATAGSGGLTPHINISRSASAIKMQQ